MILIDKMKNFKIMRQPTFLPTLERDKKKKSAALLLTPNFDSTKKLMNSNLFINKMRFESYYMERDISFYIGKEKIEDVEESAIINETKRSELPDSAFGVPSKRKFPLDTEKHVRSAIKFFNYVDPEDEAELARRIIAAMKKFNITDVKVSEKNRFSKYYHPKKSTNESYIEEGNKLYDTVVFDIGSVLVKECPRSELISRVVTNDKEAEWFEEIYEAVCNMFDTGNFEDSDIRDEIVYLVNHVSEDVPVKYIVKVYENMVANVEPYPYTRELLNRVKSNGYNVYFCSNWNKTSWEFNTKRGVFDFLEDIDGGVVSYMEGCRKPDKGIYEALCNKYNIEPSRAIFIDDKQENIDAASDFGFTEILFDYSEDEWEDLIEDIELCNHNDEEKEYVAEGYVLSEKDILYNKEAFDNGDINFCFITGFCGSGKSSMGRNMRSDIVDHIELDDLLVTKDHFTMEELKDYSGLLYSFFEKNKKYYTTKQELDDNKVPEKEYEDKIFIDFVNYAIKYANNHKDKKFVIEGIWLYYNKSDGTPYFTPSFFDKYAFYIKGTSALKSRYRSAKRDSKDAEGALGRLNAFRKNFFNKEIAKNEKEQYERLKVFIDYFKNKEGTIRESIDSNLVSLAVTEAGALNIGDTLLFFNEANDINTPQLRKLLYNSRIKNRKELMIHLASVKEQVPWIKYIFPEIRRFQSKNLYVDLSYYTNIFFTNNTWVQMRAFNLFKEFIVKLLNHPNLSSAGYTKKTIFIPVLDWVNHKDPYFWNYRKSITPISCIYQMMFDGNSRYLKEAFGNLDIIFVGENNYFKVNFSQIEQKDYKKYAVIFRNLIRKMVFNEVFDDTEVDTAAENIDSKEVIQNKIIDKIEASKGVDLTAKVYDANNTQENKEKDEDKSSKTVDKVTNNLNVSKSAMNATKQDKDTKDEIKKKQEEKAKERQEDDTLSKVAKSENESDPTNDEDIEKLAKAIAQAADDNDSEEDAMDDLDNDDIKRILVSLSSDDNEVDISPTRAARMDKMNKDLLDKQVNGRSISDILNDESNKEEEKTTVPVDSPNQDEWQDLSYMNFDKNYNIEKDIINIFRHFADCSRPISIRDIKVEDASTSEDHIMLYDVSMEDYRGSRFNVKLDIPIMEDNRFLLRGNYTTIQTQFFNMPIIKTESDTCQLITNYNKIFMYRFGSTAGKSSPIVARIIKAANKYTGRKIKFTSGYNIKVSNTYRLPIDYVDLSSLYNTIETENFIIYFNQDEIRQKYVIEEGKGVPFAYHKQENAILYFRMDTDGPRFDELLLDILMNADSNFTELFNSATRPTSCAYTRVKMMASMIPLAVVIGYYVGLRGMLDKAKISYTIINGNLPREIRNDYNKDWIKFEDGYVVYDVDYSSNLLLNGLKQCSTEIFKLEEMDSRNMYLEFLDNFGGRIKSDGLDNFRDLFIDPMIKESLEFYKLPTDYIDVLLYGNSLLADNKYIKHTDTSSRRFRRYQLIAAYTYKVLSSAYAYYANRLKHNSNAATFEVKRSAVIDLFLTDNIVSPDSVINVLRDVETTNSVTTKGPSGMNSDRAYSLDKRAYDDSMSNILGMSTGFAGNVGITRQATINSSVNAEGYTKSANGSTEDMNDANTLTATEAMIPMSSTHDDPMRVAMSFVQTAKHAVRTEESDPLLITSGADEVMPYLSTNRFCYKARMNGTILNITDEYILIEYDDGKKEMVNLKETTEHNSDGGYYVRLKLDPVKGLRKGQKIKKNQILAYDKYSFSNSLGEGENLAYNVGKLSKIAIINSDDGFEDSCIVTNDIAKSLATRIVIKYECVINKDSKIFKFAKIGDHIEASDTLVVWEDMFDDEDSAEIMAALSSGSNTDFSDLGKRKLKAEVTGELVDIKIFRTVDTSEMSESVKKVVDDYERPIKKLAKVANENGVGKDKLPPYYTLPPTGKLKKSQDAIYVEFYVEYLDTVGPGDKVCFFAANKTIVKNIIPEGKEPYTTFRPNEKISSMINSTSISKRIVMSILIDGAINKLLIELDRSVKDIMGIDFDDSKF